MKRIVKKNQFILTLLAVMIAIAGYLSYAGKFQMSGKKQAAATAAETGEGTLAAGLLEISDEELLAENQAGKDISVAERKDRRRRWHRRLVQRMSQALIRQEPIRPERLS